MIFVRNASPLRGNRLLMRNDINAVLMISCPQQGAITLHIASGQTLAGAQIVYILSNLSKKRGTFMRSVEELVAIREKVSKGMHIRNDRHEGARVVVSMGTCGIAAGARDVLSAIVKEIEKQNLDIQVSLDGCRGDCAQEPVFDLIAPGGEKTTHVRATPEQAAQAVRKLAAST